ncbi:type III-A CRISPR-associated RAMP protein Csm5 [Oscillochloris sp. ZM17-4]|uniref:type III-A CRISPR-associated RAMP protein Csm5 n=1 Tax=Oscillochloris sp. ZM17-4 TaxID=2866714 RepID=UPI001C737F3F|nr:type III-A CRISPR-associated RAMP protein Csm5 [Oscillochloris sp. ZM17-4]MBX0330706.1 type III-A CRISPR-associated RAMP protein Csm5 [Oscillochloris sp. ZM17-4]
MEARHDELQTNHHHPLAAAHRRGTARVLDYLVSGADDEAAMLDRVTRTVNLASFLSERDFRENPDLALYRLSGAVSVSEVRPLIKSYDARPYMPGSSLKGAIRTALLDTALLAQKEPPDWRKLGDRDKYAAQELERDVAGRGERPAQAPNYDIFRTIRIGDSAPGERAWLSLSNIAVWPAGERGIPIDVETIDAGSVFTSTLSIDEYLFSRHAAQLNFAPRRPLIDGMAESCRADAEARIAHERAFFAERGVAALTSFYDGLSARLGELPPNAWLMQIGWGAGWSSKTIARTLRRHNKVADVVRRYRLDRGKGRGGAFPATRHLVVDQRNTPLEPLGWVEVRMEGSR